MNLSLIFVLLISSVVIASGSSCDNKGNVTVQNPKYFESDEGFFFIHGLTNGESVVMYKTLDQQKVQVRYTFINDDCLYETTRYNINENGSFVGNRQAKVLKKPEEFLIRKTLSFNVGGKSVEIKFKINKTGFELNDVSGIKTFEPEIINEVKALCKEGLNPKEVSTFEINSKDATELNYKDNGRFFYQKAYSFDFVVGTYAFKTSNNDYYTFGYKIIIPFGESSKIGLEIEEDTGYNVKNSENFSVNIENIIKGSSGIGASFIDFCFKSTGVLINIKPYYAESPGQSLPTGTAAKAN